MTTQNPVESCKTSIIDATRNGRVQDWNERIAEIARLAKVPLERINWSKAPTFVADHVLAVAQSRSISIDQLNQAVEQYSKMNTSGDGK